MSADNPFAGIGQQFAPVAPEAQAAQALAPEAQAAPQQYAPIPPQAAPVQQAAPQYAPVPQAAPQQAAPQYAPVPQYAPAPQAAPQAPTAPPLTAPLSAPDPSQAGTAAFGSSRTASGEKHYIKDYMGQPLLLRIHEVFWYTDKKNPQRGTSEVARVDWVVLDPAAPRVVTDAWVFNSLIVRDLKETLEKGMKYHTGRVKEVPTTFGSLAPALDALTDQENQFAVQAGAALGWWPAPTAG